MALVSPVTDLHVELLFYLATRSRSIKSAANEGG